MNAFERESSPIKLSERQSAELVAQINDPRFQQVKDNSEYFYLKLDKRDDGDKKMIPKRTHIPIAGQKRMEIKEYVVQQLKLLDRSGYSQRDYEIATEQLATVGLSVERLEDKINKLNAEQKSLLNLILEQLYIDLENGHCDPSEIVGVGGGISGGMIMGDEAIMDFYAEVFSSIDEDYQTELSELVGIKDVVENRKSKLILITEHLRRLLER